VSPFLRPLAGSAILFAHRGASAHAPENTLESFGLAVRLGATGLESDVWVTADGEAVLDRSGFVGSRIRRRPISQVRRDQLPSHVPSLAELYEVCGTALPLSLDVKDPGALGPALQAARAVDATDGLWLCHPDHHQLARWRALDPDVHLIDSTRLRHLREGPERRAADLRNLGIEGINLHHSDWNGGLTTLFHRFGRLAWGWDAQHERTIVDLLRTGVDAVFSDHCDHLTGAAAIVARD
jgi:glycerophosphoryl diester phosphodiesterase